MPGGDVKAQVENASGLFNGFVHKYALYDCLTLTETRYRHTAMFMLCSCERPLNLKLLEVNVTLNNYGVWVNEFYLK